MTPKQAEKIGSDVLIWIAEDEERAGGFLGITGARAEDLREQMGNVEFLGFVLDYLLQNESYVLACADALGLHPEMIVRARAYLPGGMVPEWT